MAGLAVLGLVFGGVSAWLWSEGHPGGFFLAIAATVAVVGAVLAFKLEQVRESLAKHEPPVQPPTT